MGAPMTTTAEAIAPAADSVATPTAAYLKAEEARELPRALMEGTRAIRRDCAKWLPPMPGETDPPKGGGLTPYAERVARTVCDPFYKRAVKSAVTSILGRNVILSEDVPPLIRKHAENIDNRGNNLTVFMRRVLEDSVGDAGVSYILIDHPPMPEGATYAALASGAKRPYWVHVRARDYLNPDDFEIVNGRPRARCIRIRETITVRQGWRLKEIERVRVFTNPPLDSEGEPVGFVTWAVYEKLPDGKWEAAPREGNFGTLYPMQETTLIPVYSGYEGYNCARPMFAELAELNLSYIRKRSDVDNTLHRILPPVLHRSGVAPEDRDKPVVLAAGAVFNSTASPAEADLKYVEHTGQNITTAQEDLDRQQKRMEALALEPHVSRSSETATGRAIDFDTARTEIQALALASKDFVELCFGIHAQMIGLDSEAGGSVTLRSLSRPQPQAPQETALALEWLEKHGYSPAEIVAEGKRRGYWTEELADPPAMIDAGELPDMGGAGHDSGRPVLVLDFDGVLHIGGASGGIADVPGPPSRGAAEFLAAAVGPFRVHVFSGRSATPEGRQAMEAWCRKAFGPEITAELRFPATKPAAFVAIDDRAMTFEGTFPTPDQLLTFRAWTQRGPRAAGATAAS